MKNKLLIRGAQDMVTITVNQGDNVSEEEFFSESPIRAIISNGDQEHDVTRKLISVDLSKLQNLQQSENFVIPWKVVYNGVLMHEGALDVRIIVREIHPTITDYKIKDEGHQILIHKGVSIPRGSKNLPNIEWDIENPSFTIQSFEVFFVNGKNGIMQVDYSDEFNYEYNNNLFKAKYTGGLVHFDGKNRSGVAYILTLVPDEDDDEDVEDFIELQSDSFSERIEDASSVNDFLDNLVDKIGIFSKSIKRKKNVSKINKGIYENVVKNKPEESFAKKVSVGNDTDEIEDDAIQNDQDKESKTHIDFKNNKKENKLAMLLLTIALTILIGMGTIFGVYKYRENTLNNIHDEVSVIVANQDAAYDILNKPSLSDTDIQQLDKLLNQNQKMINDMDSNNIFIAKERNRLAKHNNDLVSEAKVKFDKQTSQ